MTNARIAELLEPFLEPTTDQRLTTDDLEHISTYIDILLRWNTRINLTAIRDPEEIVTRHFGESLFAARHLFPREVHVGTAAQAYSERPRGPRGGVEWGCPAERSSTALASSARSAVQSVSVADIGSGAGFPGIPIKLWAPHIALTLIESNHKKATFLREVVRALTLTNINIQTVRAESLKTTFALVTLRAVERFETILPIAADLVAPGGRLALLISSAQLSQAQAILPDLVWAAPRPIPISNSRILAIAAAPLEKGQEPSS